MPPAIPVILPSKTFAKKGDAKQFFKDMLNKYNDGDAVGVDDSQLLEELLRTYHPEAFDKIGSGISGFYRNPAPEGGTSCFFIERTDGIQIDFSFYWCIDKA